MKKNQLLATLFLVGASSSASYGQTAEVGISYQTIFYFLIGLVLLITVFVFVIALKALNLLEILRQTSLSVDSSKKYTSIWENFWNKSNDFIPIEQEAKILKEHSYDGIRELDNYLPPWWKGLLYISIIFCVFYIVAYHFTKTFPLPEQEYQNELAAAELAKKQASLAIGGGAPAEVIDENTVKATTDAAELADAKQIFVNTCSSCHKPDGGGDIGPNLTDQYWKHGGDIKDIFRTINNGVPNTNMISWKTSFSPVKIRALASFVLSLQGTTPANPKKPEGELYRPQ